MFLQEQLEQMNDSAHLMQKWDKRIEAVAKNKQTGLSDHEAYTLSVLLDNTERALDTYARRKSLSDTTFSETVGPFKKHALNIVSAVYSTFELRDIVSIQPISQKLGALYFLDYKYGSTKAPFTSGDTMFSADKQPFTHSDAAKGNDVGTYSSQYVSGETYEDAAEPEATGGVTANVGQNYSVTLDYTPVVEPRTGSLEIKVSGADTGASDGTYLFVSASGSDWTLSNGGVAGALNVDTGVLTIDDSSANTSNNAIKFICNYAWDSEKYKTLNNSSAPDIPRVTVSVTETIIQATRRQMLFEVSLDATYDYNQQFGRDLDGEMEATVVREVQNEMAYHVLHRMYNEAQIDWSIPTFDANVHVGSGQDSYGNAQDFGRILSAGSMGIFKALGRGHGNFIVSGSDVVQYCDHLPSTIWQPTSRDSVRGPYKAGRLFNRYDIYHNPHYADDQYLMGFKGSDWWEAPYYIGSYLPLMASKFMMFPDMHGEQGYISMDAHKYLFPNHVARGTIADVDVP